MTVVDLQAVLSQSGAGVLWTAPPGDLNANVVSQPPGARIDEHRQDEVDVLLVVLAGGGEITVNGETHRVDGQQLLLIPAGAARAVQAGIDGLSYLTVHRARGALTIRSAERGRLDG